jgi:serine/threonine-protein kinase RsbW
MEGRIVIRSQLTNLQVIDTILERIEKEYVLEEDDRFRVRLVLSEAIQNAIVHGNHSDPDKTVVIDYSKDQKSDKVFFCISDQGPGFDLSDVLDPTKPENLEREGGRGVFFLKQFTEKLAYCNDAKAMKFSVKLRMK